LLRHKWVPLKEVHRRRLKTIVHSAHTGFKQLRS
jgi:hypothetical protein